MAKKTIHSLVYKMLIDTDDMEKGALKGKKAVNLVKRELRSTLSPTEKMEVRLKRLKIAAEGSAEGQAVYNKKLKEYEKHLRDVARQESTLGKGRKLLNSKAGGIVGILGAGAAVANFKRQINRVDGLAKASDRLGISIESLTRIQFAAGQTSGMAAERTAKGLEKMVRRVSEAAAGTGEAKGVIEEIGLSARDLANSTPDEAFLKIARAMDQVTNEGDRVRIATKLFDDEQAGIHTTLALTNEELQKQFQISDNLGNTLTDVDAAKMVAAKDAMGEMAAAFDAFSTQFAIEFAPALTNALQAITKWAEKNYGDGKAGGMGSALLEAADLEMDTFGDSFRKRGVAGTFMRPLGSIYGLGHELVTGDIQKRNELSAGRVANRDMKTATAARKQRALDAKRPDIKLLSGALMSSRPSVQGSTFKSAAEYAAEARAGKSTKPTVKDAMLLAKLVGAVPGAVLGGGVGGPATSFINKSTGPAASIAAGSSAAFQLSNQTQVKQSVEVQVANKQLEQQKLQTNELKEIRLAVAKQKLKDDGAGV